MLLLSWPLILSRCWWDWPGSLRLAVVGGGMYLALRLASCVVVLLRVVGREGERIALAGDPKQHFGFYSLVVV